MLFWNGLLHARCRLTPFPVVLSEGCDNVEDACWKEYIRNVSVAPDDYRCLPNLNDDPSWTQASSPWFVKGPQDCIWPIDDDDESYDTWDTEDLDVDLEDDEGDEDWE